MFAKAKKFNTSEFLKTFQGHYHAVSSFEDGRPTESAHWNPGNSTYSQIKQLQSRGFQLKKQSLVARVAAAKSISPCLGPTEESGQDQGTLWGWSELHIMNLAFPREKVSFFQIFLKMCRIGGFPWSIWSQLSAARQKGTKDAEWILGPVREVDA